VLHLLLPLLLVVSRNDCIRKLPLQKGNATFSDSIQKTDRPIVLSLSGGVLVIKFLGSTNQSKLCNCFVAEHFVEKLRMIHKENIHVHRSPQSAATSVTPVTTGGTSPVTSHTFIARSSQRLPALHCITKTTFSHKTAY
jgi:hypothetical protein